MRMELVVLAVLASGCGGVEQPAASPPPESRPNVFEPLTDTLERAESVQQTVDDQAAELRRRLEEAER